MQKEQDSQASVLIASSHSLMDSAFAMGRMYNALRDNQEQEKHSHSSSSPKPNF